MSEKKKREAQGKIAQHVERAYAELEAAKKLADEHKLDFSFRPAYGMGGHYQGDPEERYRDPSQGWQSSSHSC